MCTVKNYVGGLFCICRTLLSEFVLDWEERDKWSTFPFGFVEILVVQSVTKCREGNVGKWENNL